MSDGKTRVGSPEKLTKEERLAAKLRENLRRRKAQARAVSAGQDAEDPGEDTGTGNRESDLTPPLAKSPPES